MNRIRALIVDDSSVMRKIIERSLRQAGIDLSEVKEASNGAEALGIVTQGPFVSCKTSAEVFPESLRMRRLPT